MAAELEPPVVIFALEREAAPFRKRLHLLKFPVTLRVSGVGRAAATRTVASLSSPSLVISAGFCGALNPGLGIGDIVSDSRQLLTVDHLVATAQEKQALRERTAADAVDMEADAIRLWCLKRTIPFLAVKAVSDTATHALSPRLANLLNGGEVSMPKVLAALARSPALLPELLRLSRHTALASERLADELMRTLTKFHQPA